MLVVAQELGEDLLGPISIEGSDECERLIQQAQALDTAFMLDYRDGGNRFWDVIQGMFAAANAELQGDLSGGTGSSQ